MWANAQRDDRPAKYSWRPLFNAAKFGWRPLLECRAVTLLRHETRWNLQGCPKLVNRSQRLVGRCTSYCEDIWGRHCCLTSFFLIVDLYNMVNFSPLTARLTLAMTQVCHNDSNKAPLYTCPQPHQMPITCHEKPTASVAQAFSHNAPTSHTDADAHNPKVKFHHSFTAQWRWILTSRCRSSASRWSRSFSSWTSRSVNIRRLSDNVFCPQRHRVTHR